MGLLRFLRPLLGVGVRSGVESPTVECVNSTVQRRRSSDDVFSKCAVKLSIIPARAQPIKRTHTPYSPLRFYCAAYTEQCLVHSERLTSRRVGIARRVQKRVRRRSPIYGRATLPRQRKGKRSPL